MLTYDRRLQDRLSFIDWAEEVLEPKVAELLSKAKIPEPLPERLVDWEAVDTTKVEPSK